jgi:hypothetical protein
MRRLTILLAAGALLAAGSALADKPTSPPGKQNGGWESHDKGYQNTQGGLPYGMQKKLERTGELPPGWEKKLEVGRVLDPDLYAQSTRLSAEYSARLPTRPAGTYDVRIEDRVVRLREQDRQITDVFQLNMR